ncbi:MAG TPA: alpha/beta hydrolase [Vicinamibacteria bacterium]
MTFLPLLILLRMPEPAAAQPLMTGQDLLALPQPPAHHTIAYGKAPQQVAELRLPEGPGPHPVVILVHGGCWQAPWGFDHLRSLAAALTAEGHATWSLEYRRLGDPGGGWPGTFEDVAGGADHLREAAKAHPLDLGRVVAVGHSAGGHLALWLAGRHRLPAGSALRTAAPLPLRGVVALAGIGDLRAGAEGRVCGDAIPQLLGGPPDAAADRVRQASPIELLPLGVPQRLICGAHDAIVPIEHARAYEAAARSAGDAVFVRVVEGAGHFELVDPGSVAFPAVRDAVTALLPR